MHTVGKRIASISERVYHIPMDSTASEPVPSARKGGWTALIVLVVLCALVWTIHIIKTRGLGGLKPSGSGNAPAAAPTKAPPPPKWESTKEQRQERRRIVKELQQKGVITELKIENDMGKMTITPLFTNLPRDQKLLVCMAALAWCLDKDQNIEPKLELIDVQTGENAGKFSFTDGLNER